MKKKYVVYCSIPYIDDYGYWQFKRWKDNEYNNEDDAIIRAYELSNCGYFVNIKEK